MTIQADASIGLKQETTYGTAVVVDRFLEFTSESLDFDRDYYQGVGLRPGRRAARSGRRVLSRDGGKGDIELEVPSRGLGTFLQAIFGVGTSTLVSAGLYQQLFTPTHNDYLPSFTIQEGVPRLGANTVDTQTYLGSECESAEFSVSNSDVLKLKTTWRSKEVQTGIAYAVPTYPTPIDLFSFVGAQLTVGGSVTVPTTTALATGGTSVADVRDFSISYDNKLDDNKGNLGGAGKRTRQSAVQLADIKGKLTAEYDSTAFRDALASNTPLALVATFTASAAADIVSGKKPVLQIVCPDVRFNGELAKVSGTDVITQSMDFTAYDNLVAAEPIYVAVQTADTAL